MAEMFVAKKTFGLKEPNNKYNIVETFVRLFVHYWNRIKLQLVYVTRTYEKMPKA